MILYCIPWVKTALPVTPISAHLFYRAQRFNDYIAYREIHGDKNPKDKRMMKWVEHQRNAYRMLLAKRNSPLTPYRLEKLRSIGFLFEPPPDGRRKGRLKVPVIPTQEELNAVWEKFYKELVHFQKVNGHCSVQKGQAAHSFEEKASFKLNKWCTLQRKEYRKHQNGEPSQMTEERIQKLAAIGYSFTRNWRDPELNEKKRKRDQEREDVDASKVMGIKTKREMGKPRGRAAHNEKAEEATAKASAQQQSEKEAEAEQQQEAN